MVGLLGLMELEIGEQHDSHEFLLILQEYVQAISDQVQKNNEVTPAICSDSLPK